MANSSILLDNEEKTEIPAAVRLAQQQGFLSMEKQPVVPVAKLFFSFDIVNSTVYKANTVNWPIIIKGLLDYIRRCVQREADLQGASLWRVIGDEMVFVYQIIDKRELYPAVDAIFRITQRVSLSIRTGKFFNTLEEQKLQKAEIEVLKRQEILSIKAAAWIAAISKEMKSPYDNIQTEYESDGSNIERVNYWLSYAETKNAAMIALNVAICAALISMSLSDRLYVIAMVGLLVSTIILMVSFFPFLANKASKKEKAKIAENYIFFGDIALIDNAKDYISNVNTCYFNGQKQNSESDKLVLDFANEIIYNSRLACRKFVAFKWALGIDVLAVACIVIQFLLPIT